MGEKVEETKKSGGEKESEAVTIMTATSGGGDNGGKKEDNNTPAPIVLKLDMHCEGCAKKVKRAIRRLYQGVANVKTDSSKNQLMVHGNVDPIWLRDKVATITKKKVELVSPPPNNDGGLEIGGGDGYDKKLVDKKEDEKKKSTEVLKIRLHCDGCAHKIKRIISRFNGVDHVYMDHQKDLVTVKGTMDVKELAHYLKLKLKRSIEIVPPKKDDGGGEEKEREGGCGGNKTETEVGGGGGSKIEGEGKASGDGGGGGGDVIIKNETIKVEANKHEYNGYNPYTYYSSAPPMYNNQNYWNQDYYGMEMSHNRSQPTTGHVVRYSNMPETSGYATNYIHMPPMPSYADAPQIFSDENPNGCSVM